MRVSTFRERFINWVTSWSVTCGRKTSTVSLPSTTSNCSSGITVSALKGSTKLTSSNTKKVVRFAEANGEVVAEVFYRSDTDKPTKMVRHLEECVDEVYIKNGTITGFIKVKNLESGRQVLVRYTEDNWESFKQVKPKRVVRKTDSKGRQHLKIVKERKSKLLRRRKQINPGSTTANQQMTFLFKMKVDETALHQVELVIISSLNDEIDTTHQQCYLFKCPRRSWEEHTTDINRTNNSSRQ